jgi:hypothetical protein
MPLAGFEPTIPVFKRAKTFHALDRAATVTGNKCLYHHLNRNISIIIITISPLFDIMSHFNPIYFTSPQNISQRLVVRFEFLTAVIMMYVFWDVKPGSLV